LQTKTPLRRQIQPSFRNQDICNFDAQQQFSLLEEVVFFYKPTSLLPWHPVIKPNANVI